MTSEENIVRQLHEQAQGKEAALLEFWKKWERVEKLEKKIKDLQDRVSRLEKYSRIRDIPFSERRM